MEEKVCIVAIVERGKADKIVEEVKKVGAKGATILYGRGTGEHEAKKLFSIHIDSSKEIILIIHEKASYQPIFDAIIQAGKLEQIGTGIIFTLPVGHFIGQ
jgi:nitrogen regulatory protein PII